MVRVHADELLTMMKIRTTVAHATALRWERFLSLYGRNSHFLSVETKIAPIGALHQEIRDFALMSSSHSLDACRAKSV